MPGFVYLHFHILPKLPPPHLSLSLAYPVRSMLFAHCWQGHASLAPGLSLHMHCFLVIYNLSLY